MGRVGQVTLFRTLQAPKVGGSYWQLSAESRSAWQWQLLFELDVDDSQGAVRLPAGGRYGVRSDNVRYELSADRSQIFGSTALE